MIWAYIAASVIFLGLCAYLIRSGSKSEQAKETARANKDLHKDIDSLVESAHRKEKIEVDHEKRIVEIVRAHGLDRGKLVGLLNSWPGDTPEAGTAKTSGD